MIDYIIYASDSENPNKALNPDVHQGNENTNLMHFRMAPNLHTSVDCINRAIFEIDMEDSL